MRRTEALPGAGARSAAAMSDAEFSAFQDLVQREAGIHLSDEKRTLLVARLSRRLRVLGLPSFSAYFRTVREDDEERVRMIDAICTNETHFFREPWQFDFLVERAVPQWVAEHAAGRRERRIRAWSAACSTGEEPYSLAMALFGPLVSTGWTVEILATDLSTKVLEKAKSAVWSADRSEEIPSAWLRRFMLRGVGPEEGKIRACKELRDLVTVRRLNLVYDDLSSLGMFDLILVRNVLIYFDAATRLRVAERLAARLGEGGLMLVGHAETLHACRGLVRGLVPGVYSAAAWSEREDER